MLQSEPEGLRIGQRMRSWCRPGGVDSHTCGPAAAGSGTPLFLGLFVMSPLQTG
jgi:hypothetical protein